MGIREDEAQVEALLEEAFGPPPPQRGQEEAVMSYCPRCGSPDVEEGREAARGLREMGYDVEDP
ncbi:MAG: hypothetical protein NWE79_08070 [Candidatus Bathyarchaeota archaeon]|nr:hypothetical protein [Candidatus Bathyarchaeota archaeon]